MADDLDPELDQGTDTRSFHSDTPSAVEFVLSCPHCHQPVPFDEHAGHEILCHQCGSSFRVENYQPVSTMEEVRLLGRFQLLECVGQGTFGAVWRARDTQLDRIVAIKVPHRGLLSSSTYRERFLREARAAAQLNHPGIVRLYEVPTLDGVPALISDFIDGVPLRDLIEAKRLTFPEAAALVADVADALDCAHSAGLVHRDIKPGNIMVKQLAGNEFKPVIVDFGLSQRAEAEIVLTVEGQIIGTPAYMSPEQARGDSRSVDGRCDVYSLGVVLYQLLTRELPFRGSKAMIVHQVIHDEPKPPRSINDKIPRDLETICLKAMAKMPGWRFQRASEMAAELRRFLKGEPILSRPIGRIERTYRWCRRNPLPAFAAAVLLVVPPAGCIVSTIFWFQAVQSARAEAASAKQAIENEQRAVASERRAIAEKNKSERGRYASDMNRAHDALTNGQSGLALRLLDAHRPENTGGPDLRGFEWYYLQRVCAPELHALRGNQSRIHSVAFSPDGRWIASAGDDTAIKLWNPATGEMRTLSGPTGSRAVAFGCDGRLLASGGADGVLRIWDVVSGTVRNEVGGQGEIFSLAFSPARKYLAWAANDGAIRIWEPATGRELAPLKGHSNRIEGLAFSPEGDRLVSAGFDHTARVWDVEHAKELAKLPHATGLVSAAWSPNGRWIATGGWDDTIHIWDPDNQKEIRALTGHRDIVTGLAFDLAGQRLASASRDQTIKIWELSHWHPIITFRVHADVVASVVFDPDGRRLASGGADGVVKILDPATPQDYTPLRGDAFDVQKVAFSGDGTVLVSLDHDEPDIGIRFWDLSRRQTVTIWHERRSGMDAFACSPDGKLIASAGDKWKERSIPGELKIRDAHTGAVIKSFRASRGPIRPIALSSDGQNLAWGEDGGVVHLYDLRTRDETSLGGVAAHIEQLVFLPDSRLLAINLRSATNSEIQIWDTLKRKNVKTVIQASGPYSQIAFSPNGRWFAAGDSDHTIRLWDTKSWEELLPLPGHSKPIRAVVFFPDNERVATAGDDQTIKIWDLETRLDLLTLHTDVDIRSLAISRDGLQLASSGNEKVIRLWDATPLNQSAREHRETLSLVKFLCARCNSNQDLEYRMQADQTISDAVRVQALALAGSYWKDWNRNQADVLIARLTYASNARPKAEILEMIRTNRSLTEAVRKYAVELAEQYQEDPQDLNWASRKALSQSNRESDAYRLALRQAQRAHELDPKNASYLTTVGMAYYRLAKHDEALKALEQAGKLSTTNDPAHLAFLAMTKYQLGKKEEAMTTFEQLREIMKQPALSNDAKAQAFFREAQGYFQR
jgi:WD40 repeat protein/Flp pilus assembly protein TadD